MITIIELIKREGRWLGGQNPNPKCKVVWSPGVSLLDLAKRAKITEAERQLKRMMNSENWFLQDIPFYTYDASTGAI